jgi:hypothetical protein
MNSESVNPCLLASSMNAFHQSAGCVMFFRSFVIRRQPLPLRRICSNRFGGLRTQPNPKPLTVQFRLRSTQTPACRIRRLLCSCRLLFRSLLCFRLWVAFVSCCKYTHCIETRQRSIHTLFRFFENSSDHLTATILRHARIPFASCSIALAAGSL